MIINRNEELEDVCSMISVIVPVYNEENTIGEVLSRLKSLKINMSMEIIVINDGSNDNTIKILKEHSDIKIIQHNYNRGKGIAIRNGIFNSNGNIIVIQDADLEYDPKQIPRLVKPILNRDADVVFGSRFLGKIEGMTFLHIIGNKILSFVAQLLYRKKITDIMTGYKAFNKNVIKFLDINENGFEVEVEITSKILKRNIKLLEVPISYKYRTTGYSKITYWHGLNSLIKLILYRLS